MSAYRTKRPRKGVVVAGALVVAVGLTVAVVPLASAASDKTVTVTSNAGEGRGSLREALDEANHSDGARIVFDIPGSGPHRIAVGRPLPAITRPVIIDGFSQRGASPNTRRTGSNARLAVEISGQGTVFGNGLTLAEGSDGSTIRGLVINGFTATPIAGAPLPGVPVFGVPYIGAPHIKLPLARSVLFDEGAGIKVESSHNTVTGTVLGLRADGKTAEPNRTAGILVTGHDNFIGGRNVADRNVISGNGNHLNLQNPVPIGTAGVYLHGRGASANTVANNIIGPSAAGQPVLTRGVTGPSAVQNTGVLIEADAQHNVIGATRLDDPGNVISGNSQRGIWIQLPRTSDNSISKNNIGTNLDGDGPLPGPRNPTAVQETGIQISGDARDDTVGVGPNRSTKPGFGNEIAWNGGDGVVIGGTERLASDFTDGHLIRFNSYHDNGGRSHIGIAINVDSGTPEQGLASPFERTPGLGHSPYDRNVTNLDEPTDLDTGPNNENNLPRLDPTTTLEHGRAHIHGKIETEPNATFFLDFYANRHADPSGYGEGEHYVGTSTIRTDLLGNATIDVLLPADRFIRKGIDITANTTKITGGQTSLLPTKLGQKIGKTAGQISQPPFSTGEFGKDTFVR